MKSPQLSIVIPAYNEAQRLKHTLPEILTFFKKQKYSWELIVVDDGSNDSTVKTVTKSFSSYPNCHIHKLSTNSGKGKALRTGILKSTGNWVLFMDADLSTPLAELNNFWPHTKSHDVIIGSRKMHGAKVIKRQNILRENLGKIFTFLTNTLATKGLSDITCGFKLFKGPVARKIFRLSRLNDWSFDAEVLFIAQKFHYSIKEIPVHWQNDPRTKVSLVRDSINSLLGLLKINLYNLLGFYHN